MNRKLVRIHSFTHCSAILIGLLVSAVANAAIPQTIGYQGFLRDSDSNPVNTPVNLVFNLYDVASGGSTLCTYTQNAVPVTNGVFSVRLLDPVAGTPSLACDTLDIDRPFYLGITVNGGAEMSPRQPFDSAPYAATSEAGFAQATVDCATQTIADALDGLPAGSGDAVITITGVCHENVKITRGNVTIKGNSLDPAIDGITGVTPATPTTPVVDINGASRVVIQALTISGPPAPVVGHAGVGVHNSASAELINTIVHNNIEQGVWVVKASSLNISGGSLIADNGFQGVIANRSSSVTIDASSILRNGGSGPPTGRYPGLVILEGSSGRLINGSRVGGSTATGTQDSDQNLGDAVDVVRSSTFTMDSSEIHAGGGSFGCGLWVADGSSARLGSSNTITSDLTDWSCAGVSAIRNSAVRIKGDSNVITMTQYQVQDLLASPQVFNDSGQIYAVDAEMTSSFRQDHGAATITGRVESFNQSTVELRGSIVNGDVFADHLSSNVRLSTRSGAPLGFTTTVNGKVSAANTSTANLRADSTTAPFLNGDLDCGGVGSRDNPWDRANLDFANFGIGFGFVNCDTVDLSTVLTTEPSPLIDATNATYEFTVNYAAGRFKDPADGDPNLTVFFTTTGTASTSLISISVVSPGGGVCTPTGQCSLGTLAPGETATVTVVINPSRGVSGGTVTAHAQVKSADWDFDPTNDDANGSSLTVGPV